MGGGGGGVRFPGICGMKMKDDKEITVIRECDNVSHDVQ